MPDYAVPINAITARTGSPHVTAYDARKLVFALGGPWPHACIINGARSLEVSINEEDNSYFDVATGVVISHGFVCANDEPLSFNVVAASSGKYKKGTVVLEFSRPNFGYPAAVSVNYSGEADTPDSINFPPVYQIGAPTEEDYICGDTRDYKEGLAHIVIHEGVIESVENILPAWNNKQFYTAGDEIDLSYMISAGYIAANSKNIYFFVPFRKDTVGITGASISGNFTIRHADGGFIGNSGGQTLESLGTVNVYLYDTGAYVRCILNDAAALTNQSVLSVHAASGAKLTFN